MTKGSIIMTSTFAHCSLFIAHCSLLTVKEAFARVLATARPLPPETLALPEAAGRVLAQSLSADRDFPPFTRVAMDGIALAHAAWAAGQTTFPIEHVQYAGAPARPLKNPRAAMEVMTGAVLPPGTDTVVRYEDLTLSEGRATINIAPPPAWASTPTPRPPTDSRATCCWPLAPAWARPSWPWPPPSAPPRCG
jgi:molybdopterin biosynthesis enzyme